MGFLLFFKQAKDWNHGIAYGIGHGGLEVIYLSGALALTQINNIALSFMIKNGTFSQLLKTAADTPSKASELETVRQQLINLPSWEFFIAGLERVDALIIQLALSLLVLYAIARHRYLFYLLAILVHALVDFSGPFLKLIGVAAVPIEGIITIYAVISFILILLSWKKRDNPDDAMMEPQ